MFNNDNGTQQSIKSILNATDKMVNKSSDLLTRLMRTMFYDLGIGNKQMENLVRRYLHDPNSGIPDTRRDRNNHRGNLMKELGSNKISWGVFMKALRVLEVEEFQLVIRLKRKSKVLGKTVTTEHSVMGVNNISYLDPTEDLSRAKVVDGFLPIGNDKSTTETDVSKTNDKSDNSSK